MQDSGDDFLLELFKTVDEEMVFGLHPLHQFRFGGGIEYFLHILARAVFVVGRVNEDFREITLRQKLKAASINRQSRRNKSLEARVPGNLKPGGSFPLTSRYLARYSHLDD